MPKNRRKNKQILSTLMCNVYIFLNRFLTQQKVCREILLTPFKYSVHFDVRFQQETANKTCSGLKNTLASVKNTPLKCKNYISKCKNYTLYNIFIYILYSGSQVEKV